MELSDLELIELWHRLNLSKTSFREAYRTIPDDRTAGVTYTIRSNNALWCRIDKELNKRGIDPEECTKTVPDINLLDEVT